MRTIESAGKGDRDIIRRTAQLLSAEIPMSELVTELGNLLADFLPIAALIIDRDEPPAPLPDGGVQMPIRYGQRVVGTLSVIPPLNVSYDADDITFLQTCALYLGARLHDDRLSTDRANLARLAATDGLTGVANRRAFDEALAAEWHRCARSNSPLSIALIDVDHFKAYNDAYGHVSGDACLQRLAHALGEGAGRPGDVFARYGGEEFAAILPETESDGGLALAQRMAAAVEALNMPHMATSLGRVSVSIGVATTVPTAETDPESLLRDADAQLYRAKSAGRNRVAMAAYDSSAAPVVRKSAIRSNIPQPRDRFFGRLREKRAIIDLLAGDPLVTVCGPGGIGKTRLAIETARAIDERFTDGVHVIDFGAWPAGADVRDAIAISLGTAEDPLSVLANKAILLVLDTCEHVAEPLARFADSLIARSPAVRILATSRVALGAAREAVIPLEPLELDDACALFADRSTDFSPSARDRAHIERIVRRLDGMPLSIELAASRAHALAADDAGAGDFPGPAAGTLASMIAWSVGLLDSDTREVFRRLGAFTGGWTLSLAREVCSDETIDTIGVVDAIGTLVGSSLVVAAGELDRKRFRFLEATRDFARADLLDSGEARRVFQRHAHAFTQLAEQAYETFAHTANRQWQHALADDADNFRSALAWCFGADGDAIAGARLAAALGPFWSANIHSAREGLTWISAALAVRDAGPAVRARLQYGAALLHVQIADYRHAVDVAAQAVTALRDLGDDAGLLRAESAWAVALLMAGDYAAARPVAQAMLDHARALENRRATAEALRICGMLAAFGGDLAAAAAMNGESLAIHRDLGDDVGIAQALGNLAEIAFDGGDADAAVRWAYEGIAIYESLEDRFRVGWILTNIAGYELTRGNTQAARVALAQALEIHRQFGHRLAIAATLDHVGYLAWTLGDPERAVRLRAFAEVLHGSDAPRQPVEAAIEDRLRSDLLVRLGAEEYEAARTGGATLTLERALIEAQRVLG